MQLEILSTKLKGELYIEYLRTLCDTLKMYVTSEKDKLCTTIKDVNQAGEKDILVFRVILNVNNLWKLVEFSNETKNLTMNYCDQQYKERVENIFITNLAKVFKEFIEEIL